MLITSQFTLPFKTAHPFRHIVNKIVRRPDEPDYQFSGRTDLTNGVFRFLEPVVIGERIPEVRVTMRGVTWIMHNVIPLNKVTDGHECAVDYMEQVP